MGNITWTDNLVNGDNVTQSHITNLKSDITGVVNGNLSNANIATGAAIAESKISFNTTTGHTHNGTDAAYVLIKHYRKGMQIEYASATTVSVLPGVLEVEGKLFVTTAATTLDITADFMDGEAEPADGPVYVYAYDNAGAIAFKFSTLLPELSDASSNTDEFPLRYHNSASLGLCRLIGIFHNRTDISADMCVNFDLSNIAIGSFVGDGNDETIVTGWTPNFVQWVVCSDATPANAEALTKWGNAQRYGFITANPQPKDLMYSLIDHQHLTSANGTANTIYNINAQTTAQIGSFTLDAPSNGIVVMWIAYSNMGSL